MIILMRTLLFLLLVTNVRAVPEKLDAWLAVPAAERGAAPEIPLTRGQAERTRDVLAAETLAGLKGERAEEISAKSITIGDKTLRWAEREFGKAPSGKRSLWISLHGGGGAPPAVNDGQWRNQIRLYQPEEGIYIAPRAPTDNWNLWHEAHIDPLFSRLIDGMVATRGVDPDKVYLLGYSAGGDGVWQLAPRMADRYAAAAMMAGHPNDASLLGLRNLPFAIFMGGEDAAYERNKIATQKAAELKTLQAADSSGYPHRVRIYPGLGHWMDGKDAEAIPWMAQQTRNPWPEKCVWFQDDVTRDRFYWLEVPVGSVKPGGTIIAAVKGNEITLKGQVPDGLTLHLSDQLVDLDAPLRVLIHGKQVFRGVVKRTPAAILSALKARPDAAACPVASLSLRARS